MQFTGKESKRDNKEEDKGCVNMLKAFIDYIMEREKENFRSQRHDNDNSITLTIPFIKSFLHQLSPLLVVMSSISGICIPFAYFLFIGILNLQSKGLEWDTVFIVKANESEIPLLHEFNGIAKENGTSIEEERRLLYVAMTRARKKLYILYVTMDSNWQMLQPSRFLKEIPNHLREIQVLRWEQIPADQRAQLMREKQEHFQKLRIENSMSSSAPTPKQIKYLQNLGCTMTVTSRLHASRLIEQYKSL